MKDKKGFTLVELLAVIAIISILSLMVVPFVIKIYNKSVIKVMHVQENKVKDAANLFVEDYCEDSLDHSKDCPSSYEIANSSGEKYICLSDLQGTDSYIKKVKYKSDSCKGIITYQKDTKTDLYTIVNVYLYCGDDEKGEYKYVTDEYINPAKYSRCNIKTNNEMYYFQIMEEKLSEIHSILQRENELTVQASNETNTSEDRVNIKNEMLELNNEINNIYNFEYLNYKIFHEDNDLTGKYVVKVVSTNGLNLDSLTYSDYNNDNKIIQEAIKDVSYFRSYLGSEQNALEYRLNFNKCNDNNCKLEVIKNIVARIYELAYNAAYSTTYTNDDLISINLEVQKLFDNLDVFSKNLSDNSLSKDSIFPNGKDTLTKDNSKKVYEDASNYIKNNTNKNLNSSSTWKDQISMYETVNGSIDDVINIVERQNELISKCSTSSLSSEDKSTIDKELAALYNEIESIKNSTTFNSINVLSDSSYYNDYLLYDLSDTNLKNISCSTSSTSSKVISDYQRKLTLNNISINANINKSNKLIEFIECSSNSCALDSVKDILDIMLSLADNAISADNNAREEYNIQYSTYFKALNHISEISENTNYSVEGLGLLNTNILTSSAASSVRTLITNKLSNIN